MVEEIVKFVTTDREEFDTREEAETHEKTFELIKLLACSSIYEDVCVEYICKQMKQNKSEFVAFIEAL